MIFKKGKKKMPLPLIPLGYVAGVAIVTGVAGWLRGRSKRLKEKKEQEKKTQEIENALKNIKESLIEKQIQNKNIKNIINPVNKNDSKPEGDKSNPVKKKSDKFTLIDLKD